MNPRLDTLRETAKKLPMEPGVYIMRDSGGKIIYIGKAKLLRNRVSSYFRSVEKHLPKVYKMVQRVHGFDYIVTASEFEALVLECSMIKQHKPKYNILLKDDKGYHYIRIGTGPYPRITAEKARPHGDSARILGPYTSSFVVSQTVEEVNKAFLLPDCKHKFPQDIRKGRPCLNYHIKQCMGVCTGRIGPADYAETIEQALRFINGDSTAVLDDLSARMDQAAEATEFEKAAILRDKIKAIRRIADQQNVLFTKAVNQDVIGVAQNEDNCCVAVLKFRERRLVDKQDYRLGEISGLPGARHSFLLSYYAPGTEIPRRISLDGECEDAALVARYLSELAGHKVVLHSPKRGENLRLVDMARANAAQQLSHKVERTGKELGALDELSRLLHLEQTCTYIEAYDISNMGSDTLLGGMVVFENGRPLKSAYRTFNIKTVAGTDDYGSMREMLSRRIARYFAEKESGEGFGRLPDLILLDGGKGHVNAVAPLLQEAGLSVPLFGMVKDDKHRTRAIAGSGDEISILSSRTAFTLVSKIQDEVHRFSITRMKQRHSKTAFELSLTAVPGIGPKRARAIYRHFKTKTAMLAATPEQLAAAPGMNVPAAQALYAFLHPAPAQAQKA